MVGFADEAAAARWLADAAELVRRLRGELPADQWMVANAHENQTPAQWVHTRPADA